MVVDNIKSTIFYCTQRKNYIDMEGKEGGKNGRRAEGSSSNKCSSQWLIRNTRKE